MGFIGGSIVILLVIGAVSSIVTETAYFMEAGAGTALAKVPTNGFLLVLAVAVIAGYAMKAVYSAKRKKKAREREAAIGMEEIDKMNGHVFERYVGTLLSDLGFENVLVTKGSGDQGVDVVASLGSVKYGVQCKRQSADVGNKAVQEVYSGLSLYGCNQGAVITNANYTKSAEKLAASNSVILWNREDLKEMISDRLDGIRYHLDSSGAIVKVKATQPALFQLSHRSSDSEQQNE